jgi:hypothetical protein
MSLLRKRQVRRGDQEDQEEAKGLGELLLLIVEGQSKTSEGQPTLLRLREYTYECIVHSLRTPDCRRLC